MSKFKLGDKVRVVFDTKPISGYPGLKKGRVYEVEEVTEDELILKKHKDFTPLYRVDDLVLARTFNAEYFELVEPVKMETQYFPSRKEYFLAATLTGIISSSQKADSIDHLVSTAFKITYNLLDRLEIEEKK